MKIDIGKTKIMMSTQNNIELKSRKTQKVVEFLAVEQNNEIS